MSNSNPPPTQSLRARLGRMPLRVRMLGRIRPRSFGAFGTASVVMPPAHIHTPSSIKIGTGTYIGAGAVLSMNAELRGRSYSPQLTIGDRCQFGEQLFISGCGEIDIGDDVLGSDRVFITDTYHEFEDPKVPPVRAPLATPRTVRIGNGAFLGIGCCILAGVSIGERAYVAANAVVTSDVDAWTVVAGNPARPIKRWDGERWVKVEAKSTPPAPQQIG